MDFLENKDFEDQEYLNLFGSKKRKLSREEEAWAVKFPESDNPVILENTINAARAEFKSHSTKRRKDRISREALGSYIAKLSDYIRELKMQMPTTLDVGPVSGPPNIAGEKQSPIDVVSPKVVNAPAVSDEPLSPGGPAITTLPSEKAKVDLAEGPASAVAESISASESPLVSSTAGNNAKMVYIGLGIGALLILGYVVFSGKKPAAAPAAA